MQSLRRLFESGRRVMWRVVFLLAVLPMLKLSGEEKNATAPPPPREPERQELWVPSEQLDAILKKHPNAVLLSAEEYEALVRDAGRVKPEPPADTRPPPEAVVVEGLYLSGKVEEGASWVSLRGELTLRVLAEGWQQVEISWPLAMREVSGDPGLLAVVEPTKWSPVIEGPVAKDANPASFPPRSMVALPKLRLFVRGKGVRQMRFVTDISTRLPNSNQSAGIILRELGCGGLLELELPDHYRIVRANPFRMEGKMRAFVLGHGTPRPLGSMGMGIPGFEIKESLRVEWLSERPEQEPNANWIGSLMPDVAHTFRNDVIESRFVMLASAVAPASGLLKFKLPSPRTEVVQVMGGSVASWRKAGNELVVSLTESTGTHTLEVQTLEPFDIAKADGWVELPILTSSNPLNYKHRVVLNEEVDWVNSEGLTQVIATPNARLAQLTSSHFFSFEQVAAAGQPAPRIRLKTHDPRVEADIDTLGKLEKDTLAITRSVALRADRAIRELRFVLPEGEEVARVECAATGFEWRRVGQEIHLRFPQGIGGKDAATPVRVESRKRLLRAWSGPGQVETMTLENLGVPDAVKVAGYLALEFDESWRVSAGETRGLEDRDARLTPVKGRMAWFGLREWSLGIEVERAEPVYSAIVTAHALPRARSVEVEGQFALDIRGAPLRQFEARLPVEQAERLRVTSPLLAEQQLDAATGVWRFTLREETLGQVVLRFRMSLPAAPGEGPLTMTLPRIELPGARRFQGNWVVEANTDTELSFTTRDMQPLDVLHAPAVTDYTPRHRLVGAFAFGIGDHELTLTASRHAHSELAQRVVEELRLTSVLSSDGSSRHEAVLRLRHSGEQFMHLRLPRDARLLSLVRDGELVKPVHGADGALAVALTQDGKRQVASLRVLYHLEGHAWGGAGWHRLEPVELAPDVPILRTDWRVHLPEGYGYEPVRTRLRQSGAGTVPGLFDTILNGIEALGKMRPGPDSHLETDVMDAKLNGIRFPQVTFSGATLEEALEFIAVKSRDLDPGDARSRRKGVDILLLGDAKATTSHISLDLTDVPLRELLRYVTDLAGVQFQVEPQGIVVGSMSRPFVRAYEVPLEVMKPVLAGGETVMDWLKEQGIVFNGDARAEFDAATGRLVVRNTKAMHDQIEAFLSISEETLGIKPVLHDRYLAGLEDRLSRVRPTLDLMERIVLPQVKFSGAPLREALDFLQTQSRALDPAGRGISIVLNTGDTPVVSTISLDLTNVPLAEALRYVTDLAGMKYKVESHAVQVLPLSATNTEMYQRIFRVPPDFLYAGESSSGGAPDAAPSDPFASPGVGGGTALPARRSSIDLLRENGITFGEGATAVFNRATNQLIVRNTQAMLDQVESLVESLSAGPAPAPADKSGLLPLELELPLAGIPARFYGTQAPEVLVLRFRSWERQLAEACGWMLLGVLGFVVMGRRSVLTRSLLVVVLLAAAVPLAFEKALPVANALLLGWFAGIAVWLLWRLLVWATRPRAVISAQGEEVTV